MTPFPRILIGIEALEGSTHAHFASALDLAHHHRAVVVIAFVLDTNEYTAWDHIDPFGFQRWVRQAQATLQAYQDLAKARGLEDVHTVVEIGDPARKLRQLHQAYHIDLLLLEPPGPSKREQTLFHDKVTTLRRYVNGPVQMMEDEDIASTTL